jgi:hypothetical protein
MVNSAAGFCAGSEEGFDVRGDILEKDDRSFVGQRFRQVAPGRDEAFVSRVALRRLCTQLLSDHFFGVVIAAANAANPKSVSVGVPSREFRTQIDGLLGDLRQLVVETGTDESIELSIGQLRGATGWDTKERYPSLPAFARDEKALASFAPTLSGKDAPALFERLLAQTGQTNQTLPKICRRTWDNTYWWADGLCSRTLGALVRLCSTHNIQFHFRAKLSLLDLNAAALTRLNQRWEIVLCPEPVREAVKHVARTLSLPLVCLSIPVAPLGAMKEFDSDLVELRNQNISVRDSLVCFPADHSAAEPLAKELTHRSDVIDILTSLPYLIEALPPEDRDEPEMVSLTDVPPEQYQLSLW